MDVDVDVDVLEGDEEVWGARREEEEEEDCWREARSGDWEERGGWERWTNLAARASTV